VLIATVVEEQWIGFLSIALEAEQHLIDLGGGSVSVVATMVLLTAPKILNWFAKACPNAAG
jgi:hypothetical protein